jgi:hypothetical protein
LHHWSRLLDVHRQTRWVLLTYRLPREPSTPRISLWRQLRRLGAAQVADGVAALPMDARTREQLEWLAEEVVEAGGEATIWFAEPGSAGHERALAQQMAHLVQADYEAIIAEANAATTSEAGRRRTLARLRRELRRIRSRDWFPSGLADRAHAAVEALAQRAEAAS